MWRLATGLDNAAVEELFYENYEIKKKFLFLQVLHFQSYFLENVDSNRIETRRIRNCHLYYYLEDDSLQVSISPTFYEQLLNSKTKKSAKRL